MFRDLSAAYRIANDKLFDAFGIREVGQPLILFILDQQRDSGAVDTQKQLADILRVSPATVTISIKSLEKRGLVRKKSDEHDMRCNRVEITDAGRDMARKFREAINELDGVMYAGFSEEELKTVSSLFVRMTENLLKYAGMGGEERGE